MGRLLVPLVAFIFLIFSVAHGQGVLHMKLKLLPHAMQTLGAMCMDGTPYGYYFSPGSGNNVNDWILYIEGGGWCYNEGSCYYRAQSGLGSSSYWAKSSTDFDGMSGLMDNNCTVNPTFCNYTKISIPYCDGTSFTSNRSDPAVWNNTKLWFRGRNNLLAVLQDINATMNFGNASSVLLSGCSAGGLSTFHAADYVASLLPSSVKKYGALPGSGYFLQAPNIEGKQVYPEQMAYVYQMGNCSGGVSQQCREDAGPEFEWQCIFAQNALPHIESPIFVSNSMFDIWQLICVFTSEPSANETQDGNCLAVDGWAGCLSFTDGCTDDQYLQINSYGKMFVNILNGTANAHKPGNGGFITSCWTHCESIQMPAWQSFTINGVTMQQAIVNWWNSIGSANPGNNWHWDCTANLLEPPYACNPTC